MYIYNSPNSYLQTKATNATVAQHVRAVLDLGSQRSYISQRAAKSLHLKPEEVCKMAVFTFGSTEKTLQNCECVTLKTSPIICEPLTDQRLSLCVDSYEHLSDLTPSR